MFRFILATAAIGLHLAVAGSSAAEPAQRPNVIIVISDDQGWRDIGYNGSDVLTPHLDRLAAGGVRLDCNYVWPTCSPTRIALLAGRAPSRYGVLGPIGGRSTQSLPPQTVTLADTLHNAGYYTAISGKWHLGLRPEVGPRQYGFDSTYGYLHGQVDPYTHIYKNGDRTWHRQDQFIDEQGHATDLLTGEVVRIIERDDDRPFFVYAAYSVPHYPLQEPDAWLSLYEGKIADPDRRLFAASLTHMDAGIGRIVEALDRTQKRDNTLLIFTSDNGGQQNWGAPKTEYDGRYRPNKTLGDNRPLRGWKGDLYEGGIRVPAFANWPGQLKPRAIGRPVSILDWYPTIAALIGVEIDPALKLEGRNIWPLLAGDDAKPAERTLYWKTGGQFALRHGDWKLIENRRSTGPAHELFNLADDPHEKTDLAAKHPDRIESLRNELERQKAADAD